MKDMIYFSDRKVILSKEIKKLSKQLEKLPEGHLVCYKNKNSVKWYREHQENGVATRKYLPKKEFKKARLLAQKTFLARSLADKQNELKSIESYMKVRKDHHVHDMLASNSPFRPLLSDTSDWGNQPYEKSNSHPEHLIHRAPKGELVRSKSEAMIAAALYERGIQYRYECVTDFDGVELAPDFTIIHPITKKLIIWEHFGKCESKQYQSTIIYRLPIYLDAGFIPGKNMITTYETKDMPLQLDEINDIIDRLLS